MNDIKSHLRESKNKEVLASIADITARLNEEGYTVEFGNIGVRTTYALLTNKEADKEIVGYTFIRDMRYYNENTGKLKALQQAIARKEMAESSEKE